MRNGHWLLKAFKEWEGSGVRDEANELLRSTGKNGDKRNDSGPFGVTFDVNRFRNAERGFIKALLLIPASLVLALIAFVAHHEWLKASLDAQVREMCEKDGGIKVYETVKLQSERFNEWGQVNFYKPTRGEDALGNEYLFKESIRALQRGDPELLRYHYEVIRRSDSKLLSETVSYQRGGGDLPGPGQPSVFTCPAVKDAGPNALLKNTFLRSQK
jgi:hypothetical protein